MRSQCRPADRCAWRCLLGVVALASLAACVGETPEPAEGLATPGPTRGYILISLDTLSAAHLGAYGYHRPTSPFFDALAERGALFEHAFVQYPSTLVSHASIFTGLYPQQHGVYPPAHRLSPAIATLPERFSAAGYRTAGHTEGGFVGRGYGFARGFDEFSDPRVQDSTDIERTFDKGLDFLERLGAEDRFFLFLHTYSIHDPYEPPEPWASLFWPGEPPGALDKLHIGRVNAGLEPVDERGLEFFEARYDGGIRYADQVLAGLFDRLEALGILGDTTVVITSDHGEEFGEHGRVGHTQLYPETLRVPLLVLHPELSAGRRVSEVVESIDLAPTLLDLAGLPPLEAAAGSSLVPLIAGQRRATTGAYAEVLDSYRQRSLVERREDRVVQAVETTYLGEGGGTWISRSVSFDWPERELELSLASFRRPRRVEVEVGGRQVAGLDVGTSWSRRTVGLPDGASPPYRVTLSTPECDSPRALGLSDDARCLSIKVREIELRRGELFDLTVDGGAAADISDVSRELHRELAERLAGLEWQAVAPPVEEGLAADEAEALRALGYIQ